MNEHPYRPPKRKPKPSYPPPTDRLKGVKRIMTFIALFALFIIALNILEMILSALILR